MTRVRGRDQVPYAGHEAGPSYKETVMRRRMIVLFLVLIVFARVPIAAQQVATMLSPQAAEKK